MKKPFPFRILYVHIYVDTKLETIKVYNSSVESEESSLPLGLSLRRFLLSEHMKEKEAHERNSNCKFLHMEKFRM